MRVIVRRIVPKLAPAPGRCGRDGDLAGESRIVHPQTIIHLADLLQIATVAASLFGFAPQIVTLHRTKDSHNHSLLTWLLWSASSLMALFYALAHYLIEGCCLPLAITTSVNSALSALTLALVLKYRASLPHYHGPHQSDPRGSAARLEGSVHQRNRQAENQVPHHHAGHRQGRHADAGRPGVHPEHQGQHRDRDHAVGGAEGQPPRPRRIPEAPAP
ncbi:PQ-loop repeat-containing protein [Tautonia sociabilis]|uniref:PQ-loop repeat-containing protein n=1 Tax=Tautonia sociabilis TaxID=2080755 RepID=A0A432MKT7_9BACT|nr:PQ-loop repeat-containing protein [Tautonia sociabilis]